MRVGFIGAGKVGFTLGRYFKDRGADAVGYYSRSRQSAHDAADFTGTNAYSSIEDIVKDCDLLFLTVPDSAVGDVWIQLKKFPLRDKIICHCSGALSSDVFDGILDKEAFGYSVHPFYAIYSKTESYKELHNAFFSIEGNIQRLPKVKSFIESMGNATHVISAEEKVKYHVAAVFLSNHAAALAYTGGKLLKECGFEDSMVNTAIKTLFLNYCAVMAEHGIAETLTGPVERNDFSTVKKHMDCLDGNDKLLYGLLSEKLVDIAKKKHNRYDYSVMEHTLKEELREL